MKSIVVKCKVKSIFIDQVSNNFDRRFRDICNSIPFNCDIILNKEVKNAYDLEELIHFTLKENHVKSEWFELNNIDFIIKKINKWQADQ